MRLLLLLPLHRRLPLQLRPRLLHRSLMSLRTPSTVSLRTRRPRLRLHLRLLSRAVVRTQMTGAPTRTMTLTILTMTVPAVETRHSWHRSCSAPWRLPALCRQPAGTRRRLAQLPQASTLPYLLPRHRRCPLLLHHHLLRPCLRVVSPLRRRLLLLPCPDPMHPRLLRHHPLRCLLVEPHLLRRRRPLEMRQHLLRGEADLLVS